MTAKEFEKKFGFWLFCGADMWTSLPELPPFAAEVPLVAAGCNVSTNKASALCVLVGEKQLHIGYYSQIGDSEPMWRDDRGNMIFDNILKWIPIPNLKEDEKC